MILIVLPDFPVEDALMRRLKQGEQEAISEVYAVYFPPLYQYVRLKVGDSAAAEDIVSEVFVTLIESLGKRSAPRVSLRGWLFKVARNQISRNYGKIQHLPLTDVEQWMPASSNNNPESRTNDIFDMERVRHALRMLTADHQEVLILRFGQNMSLKETADIMGKNANAIKALQFRALATLRQIVLGSDKEVNHV